MHLTQEDTRCQDCFEESPPQAPRPPAAAPPRDRVAQLKDLANLKAQGILTEAEFAAEKARILG